MGSCGRAARCEVVDRSEIGILSQARALYDVIMEDKTERLIAHLAMIQAVIARMASNSFALKTLTITLCAGVVALVGSVQNPKALFLISALAPVAIFAWMDAKYLQLERLYRALYEDVRRGSDVEPFDMRTQKYIAVVPSTFALMRSWSIFGLYGTIFLVLAIVAFGLWRT